MLKKITAVFLCFAMLVPFTLTAFADTAESGVSYEITNPYTDVTELLGNSENHYKTNLHTHSSVSDGRILLPDQIKTHYEQGFDILGMAEHGVIGKRWNEEPTHYFLMRIATLANAISDNANYFEHQFDHLTDEEFAAITAGTYEFDEDGNFNPTTTIPFSEESSRTYGRGMNCVTTGIELSAASVLQSHLTAYFSDWGEKISGLFTHEGDYEYFVKNVENHGGVTVINHPGHYLNSKFIPENATDENQLFYFADIFNRYESCLGIETYNNSDSESQNNRLFWDELLQYVIPYGKRNVFGFSNNDSHDQDSVDTEFMDFILPSYSEANLRTAMETGAFFATGRRAKNSEELGYGFVASGPVPRVIGLEVDDENDIITVTAQNATRIEWIANGDLIEKEVTTDENGNLVSVLKLREHSDDITCYVRFRIFGDGGYCCSNPFICDDGNMQRFIIKDERDASVIAKDKADRLFTQSLFGALIKLIEWEIEKDKA